MIAKVFSATMQGLEALPITIEVSVTTAPQFRFSIVGLPDSAVRESQERVLSSLQTNGYKMAMKQVVVNLAPADVKKEGSGFDLPISIGIMASMGKLPTDQLHRYMFVGELSLDGTVQPVKGALPIAIKAREMGYEGLFVPADNAREAAVVNRLKVYGIHHMQDVIGFLSGTTIVEPTDVNTREEFYAQQSNYDFDFDEVKGQENVKRAFEVAAAGGHNILLVGSPGCGKSMMSKRLPSILPPLSLSESLETTQIHSIAGKISRDTSLISQRPFRSPHHTISDVW
ncbi:MAG: ATP-binding protein [Bacteroidaceae bacterium]|nr:ATP-binding protein [Bacteroidaceae bacterium]